MAFCRKCGEIIDDEAVVCPKCGVAQRNFENNVMDNGGFGYIALGCCIPVVGLVLYILWKDEKPNTAKNILIGMLIFIGLYFGNFFWVII